VKNENGQLALEAVVSLRYWKTRLGLRRGRERGRRGVGLNYARPQLHSANQVNNRNAEILWFLDPEPEKLNWRISVPFFIVDRE
jgi:hypothetical protein